MFKYFGSKFKLASSYPVPRHGTIIEPFAGAAAYAVLHGASRRVLLIEKDERVAETWVRLLRMTPKSIASMRTPPAGSRSSDLLVALAAGRTTRDTPTEFVVSPRMAQRHQAMIRRMAATVDRCRHFEIICGDFTIAPDIEATWFVDPPYQANGGRWDRTRGGRYRHPNREIDYGMLGAWCKSRNGQVIACDQEGAKWLPFQHVIETRDGGHAEYREVWWGNEDIDDGTLWGHG